MRVGDGTNCQLIRKPRAASVLDPPKQLGQPRTEGARSPEPTGSGTASVCRQEGTQGLQADRQEGTKARKAGGKPCAQPGLGVQRQLPRIIPASVSHPSSASAPAGALAYPLRDQLQESEHDRPRRLWVAVDWRESTPSGFPATQTQGSPARVRERGRSACTE